MGRITKADLETKINELENNLMKSNFFLKETTEERNKLKNERNEMMRRQRDEIKKLNDEIEIYKIEINRMDKECTKAQLRAKDEQAIYRNKIQEIKKEYDIRLNDEIQKLTHEYEEEIQKLKHEYEKEIQELKHEKKILSEQIITLKDKNEQKLINEKLTDELKKCYEEKEILKKQCDEMISGKYWEPKKNERGAGRKSIVTDKMKEDVNQLRAKGMKIKEIAEKLGISTGLTHKIINS